MIKEGQLVDYILDKENLAEKTQDELELIIPAKVSTASKQVKLVILLQVVGLIEDADAEVNPSYEAMENTLEP